MLLCKLLFTPADTLCTVDVLTLATLFKLMSSTHHSSISDCMLPVVLEIGISVNGQPWLPVLLVSRSLSLSLSLSLSFLPLTLFFLSLYRSLSLNFVTLLPSSTHPLPFVTWSYSEAQREEA